MSGVTQCGAMLLWTDRGGTADITQLSLIEAAPRCCLSAWTDRGGSDLILVMRRGAWSGLIEAAGCVVHSAQAG